MRVKLNVKSLYLAKEIMISDKYRIVIQRLKSITIDTTYKTCVDNNLRVREYLINDRPKKYVNVEDMEEFLWRIISSVWVGDYDNDADYEDTQIELEGEQEIYNFIKLPSYLEKLDEIDTLCRNLRKGWIDESYYAADEDEPYISIEYIQNELNRILN